jgi:hypothetical protein
MKRQIKKLTSDSNYFLEDINTLIKELNIKETDVINITENDSFTTLWYWGE